jgi:hypothetical protein
MHQRRVEDGGRHAAEAHQPVRLHDQHRGGKVEYATETDEGCCRRRARDVAGPMAGLRREGKTTGILPPPP